MSKLAPDWRTTSVFEAVFDQLPDALVLWDPEFRITGVNRSAETLFGMSSREMLGKHCREVFRSSVCEAGVVCWSDWKRRPRRAAPSV